MSDQGHAQQPLHELLTEARQYLVDFGIDEDPETNNNLDALILKIDAALAGEATSSDLSEEALLTIAARCGLSSARPPDETREEVEAQIAYFREHADEFAAAHRGIVDSGRPPREQLRRLVDIVWNECSESTAVPSTNWADRMIDKVFNPGAKEPEANGGLCAIAPHAVRVGEPTRIGAVVGDQEAAEPSSIQDSGRPPRRQGGGE